MAERIKHEAILRQVDNYYTQKLKEYGATYMGVDWKSQESQILRFDQLLKVTGHDSDCSILDYGCGWGAMARYIRELDYNGRYFGFDISSEMIREARKQTNLKDCIFLTNIASIPIADYTMASGIFNVKQQIGNEEWETFVVDTIDDMAKHSSKGFAFNMLTSYSDKDKMRPDLYYGDPCFFVDHCIRNFSRSVAILHDYGLYEFTILVNPRGD